MLTLTHMHTHAHTHTHTHTHMHIHRYTHMYTYKHTRTQIHMPKIYLPGVKVVDTDNTKMQNPINDLIRISYAHLFS